MSKNVVTKWHHLVEMSRLKRFGFYGAGTYISTNTLHKYLDYDKYMTLLDDIEQLPKLVIDDALEATMTADLIADTVYAMKQADVLHLPYPRVLVEVTLSNYSNERWFVLCEEDDFKVEDEHGVMRDYQFRATPLSSTWEQDYRAVVVHPVTVFTKFDLGADEPSDTMRVCAKPAPYISDVILGEMPSLVQDICKLEAAVVSRAMAIAFVVTGTAGVKKEVLEYERLNRARKRSGKPSVPRVSFMRIGHTYRPNGERVEHEQVNGDAKLRRVYFRKGHIRNQRYGKGLTESKVIFINPMLVNYRPDLGDSVPAPTTRVKW